jgi:hypothetical protein
MIREDDHEHRVGKDLEGNSSGIFQSTILGFIWRD